MNDSRSEKIVVNWKIHVDKLKTSFLIDCLVDSDLIISNWLFEIDCRTD